MSRVYFFMKYLVNLKKSFKNISKCLFALDIGSFKSITYGAKLNFLVSFVCHGYILNKILPTFFIISGIDFYRTVVDTIQFTIK